MVQSAALEAPSADLIAPLTAILKHLLPVFASIVCDWCDPSDVSLSSAGSDATQLTSAGTLPDATEDLLLRPPKEAKCQRVTTKGSASHEVGSGIRLRVKEVKHCHPFDITLCRHVSRDSSLYLAFARLYS